MTAHQQESEQSRDWRRAEAELERFLVKVETGMVYIDDVDEARTILRMMGINIAPRKPKEAMNGDQNK